MGTLWSPPAWAFAERCGTGLSYGAHKILQHRAGSPLTSRSQKKDFTWLPWHFEYHWERVSTLLYTLALKIQYELCVKVTEHFQEGLLVMRPRMTYSALQAQRASSAKARAALTKKQWCNLPSGTDPLDVVDLSRHAFAFHALQHKGCLWHLIYQFHFSTASILTELLGRHILLTMLLSVWRIQLADLYS